MLQSSDGYGMTSPRQPFGSLVSWRAPAGMPSDTLEAGQIVMLMVCTTTHERGSSGPATVTGTDWLPMLRASRRDRNSTARSRPELSSSISHDCLPRLTGVADA